MIGAIIEIIRSIRNARAEYKVKSSLWIAAQIYAGRLTSTIRPYGQTIQTLSRAKPITFHGNQEEPSGENNLVLVLQEIKIVIPMESMLNLKAEITRLQKEIAQSRASIAQLEARLNDANFLTRAPAAVV